MHAREVVSLLRRFHLGDPSAAKQLALPGDDYFPALLSAYRGLRRFRYEYPLLLVPPEAVTEENFVVSMEQFLAESIESFAAGDGSARILKDNLAWLDHYLREQLTGRELPTEALPLVEQAAAALQEHLGLKGDNAVSLAGDLESLVACVLPRARFLALSANSPFHLLHHVMTCLREKARAEFQVRLDENVRGLKRLLAVEKDKSVSGDSAELASRVGPGARFLNTENLSGVAQHRSRGTVTMSAERLKRVQAALAALESFSDAEAKLIHLVIRPGSVTLAPEDTFEIIESNDPCKKAMAVYDDQAGKLAKVFSAVRIAELEIAGGYEPSVHDSWFENFDWEAFTDEELHLVPSVVAVEATTHAVGKEMHSFSRALNSGKPVQIVMTVSAHGNPEQKSGDPLSGFRVELGYLGIGHREAIVNQVSAARVKSLVAGFASALDSTRPGLHLIHTGFAQAQPVHPWLLANAALESRAHPYIRYNPACIDGGKVDFDENPQKEDDWASGEFSYKNVQGEVETKELRFTFADYCLLKPDLHSHFRRILEECQSEDLVGIDEFLDGDSDHGRVVPFVWSVDGDGVLQRLAVSRELAFCCRDRLGYWRGLQSMAGVHNYYVDQAVANARAEEQAKAAEELKALRQAHEEEVENVRTTAAEDIMGRLTDVLLGLDLSDAALKGSAGATAPAGELAPAAPAPAESEPAEEEAAVEAPPAPEEEEVSFDEPWIDSMLCTSCDDCLAINKMMFVYNEDKQCFIKDAKAGTFAQLVQAAELCPAKCIHPGKPLDPGEPGLDELIKRAEPFN